MNLTAEEEARSRSFNPHHPDRLAVLRGEIKSLPRHSAERLLRQKLGEIEGVFVADFKERSFTLRVTTNHEILRLKVEMRPQSLLEDIKNYDPWSTRWMTHMPFAVHMETVKTTVDSGDLLHAHMLLQFRKMAMNEKSDDYKKSDNDLYGYEDVLGMDNKMMDEKEEEEVSSGQYWVQDERSIAQNNFHNTHYFGSTTQWS